MLCSLQRTNFHPYVTDYIPMKITNLHLNELIYYGKGINSIQKILKRYTPISNIFWEAVLMDLSEPYATA